MPLTPKQKRFAQEYVLDGNASAAAIRAGFSPGSARVTACRLLKANPYVQAAVRQEQAEIAARVAIDRERVLAELQDAVDLARVQGDPAAMIAGWREIARICGYYSSTSDRSVPLPRSGTSSRLGARLGSLSDAALAALASSDAAG
jgi:phage terminase small subunit